MAPFAFGGRRRTTVSSSSSSRQQQHQFAIIIHNNNIRLCSCELDSPPFSHDNNIDPLSQSPPDIKGRLVKVRRIPLVQKSSTSTPTILSGEEQLLSYTNKNDATNKNDVCMFFYEEDEAELANLRAPPPARPARPPGP